MSENKGAAQHEEMLELRRGPWTLEEDTLLIHYIACHGEGRWNLLARCSGLKRTGKSCRLRWLNYLKPDVKRGNLSPEEQLMILELHSKWGNRWSRIAQHLPGRTDNEIKNYWRTRVQKQARQLKIDANSAVFRDAVRCYWMPRLLEKMASSSTTSQSINSLHPNATATALDHHASFPPPVDSRMQSSIHRSRCDELSGSDNCGSSVSSVAQLPNLSELPWSRGGELGSVPFNPFLSGHCIGGAYDRIDASGLDSGPASGYPASDCATAGNDFVDDDIADTLWGIVESYMNGLNGDDTC